ncbi:DUF4846 domain-containing protein [Psychroserpens sp.]|uniref:DUF4846 domain-containing protein n=1 Tax=Psychroserpens sp. TaxID=2020870 RepID=UPI001B0AC8D0|nr:DUF4846 domain-containing protein [Psychroserpens sp.]MBO6605918.1 DUF4846 domain-containing protein [Psychroserpens sp.]MBO6652711.1 DUF4846 domain-containing protein [Psychroserpens sp.]MBO6681517.1 DUF4846 domain-containing protein [Psychroserpens sp.]MBO6749292.1 DUF4846 domain-containing protein [Psychroserpens sp.]MBO6914262.1 DUF4846 domain-containing protein [Psychroserpens sp.]
MKKALPLLLSITLIAILIVQLQPVKQAVVMVKGSITKPNLINKDSLTIKSRVNLPEGYSRVNYPAGSFQDYLRNYKLKPYGSKIINYDNSEYFWQGGHIGILEVPVPSNGLQQCADALIRIRSEYLWEKNRTDEIGFKFTSGHYCSWTKYAEGFRPKINGNKVTFHKTASADHSKTNFYKYLNLIYTYSGTLSLYHELTPITYASNLKIGDMMIKGGTPGHIVMICDEIINAQGEKKYLIFQGNTPAQSVHLVRNLEDDVYSPWYKLENDKRIPVSNYVFGSAKFVRFK